MYRTDPSVIQKIEDLSLNAWPSYQIQFYDGWILRYSDFYTHRTNCVEQIAKPALPLPEKIRYCEEMYRAWHSPCAFKLTPLSDPALPRLLWETGYHSEHPTEVMLLEEQPGGPAPLPFVLPDRDILQKEGAVISVPDGEGLSLRIAPRTDALWLDGLFALKGMISPHHRRIVPQMYAAIPKEEAAVSVLKNGSVCATGLGIFDRDTVGVYAIHVKEELRRKGIGQLLVRTILAAAAQRGISMAYLQVAKGNDPARRLYERQGFRHIYDYSFAVKELPDS